MVRSSLQNSRIDFDYYRHLLTRRFLANPRMKMIFGDDPRSLKKKVGHLVNYCFGIAKRLDGVYVASNGKTIVLYYEKKQFKKTWIDHFRYLKVALSIPLGKIPEVLKKEKEVASHRLDLENYLYVWFIAQEEDYNRLDGLVEINKMLADVALKRRLPLLFETSDDRLLRFYKQAGYTLYNTMKRNHETTYFFIDKNSESEVRTTAK